MDQQPDKASPPLAYAGPKTVRRMPWIWPRSLVALVEWGASFWIGIAACWLTIKLGGVCVCAITTIPLSLLIAYLISYYRETLTFFSGMMVACVLTILWMMLYGLLSMFHT